MNPEPSPLCPGSAPLQTIASDPQIELFCRAHDTPRRTPAMAPGVTDRTPEIRAGCPKCFEGVLSAGHFSFRRGSSVATHKVADASAAINSSRVLGLLSWLRLYFPAASVASNFT